tara:strand:- start:571 stop:2787 length:2217 start_codon:yes stop_codon:yes gene_type:complete
MAVKTIDLVINTSRGEKNIKQALALAKRFEQTLGNISKLKFNIKTDPAQRAIEKLNAQIERGRELTQKTFSAGAVRAFGNSIADVRDEISAVSKAFEATSDATERMNMASALIAGNFKQIRMEAVATAKATGQSGTMQATVGSVQGRLKEIRGFPKTILAGKKAMGLLNKMLELAEVNSKDFLDISKAIGQQLKINADMQKALDTASGRTKSKSKSETEKKIEKQITAEKKKQKQLELDLLKVRQKRINQQKKDAAQQKRTRQQQRQGTMLGAGFPLLFGGGVGSVAGSLAGSMLAPAGMQFGGQILGSALGTILEQNLQKVHAIGDATKHVNLDALEESGIRVNSQLEDAVENLRMMNKESQAQELISQEVANQTGTVKGTNEDIADLLGLLGREWKNFTTIISSTLGILSVPFVAALTLILRLVNGIFWVVNKILSFVGYVSKEAIRLIRFIPGAAELLEKIAEYVDDMNHSTQELRKQFNGYIRDLQTQEQAILRRIELGDKEAAIQEKIAEAARTLKIDKDTDKEDYERLENAIRSLAALEKQEEAVKKLRDLYKTLGQTIEDGLVNAIQAAIDGTKTLGQVASSVFRELSRALIRFGVNSLIGSIFSSGPTKTVTESVKPPSADGLSLGSSFNTSNYGNFDTSKYGKFASGGRPPVGKPSIVGEKGPELFMPDRAGTIIPNHALGSTNVVVNVDASGSSVEGDEQKGRELGQMLSAAIQSELIKQKRPGGLLT